MLLECLLRLRRGTKRAAARSYDTRATCVVSSLPQRRGRRGSPALRRSAAHVSLVRPPGRGRRRRWVLERCRCARRSQRGPPAPVPSAKGSDAPRQTLLAPRCAPAGRPGGAYRPPARCTGAVRVCAPRAAAPAALRTPGRRRTLLWRCAAFAADAPPASPPSPTSPPNRASLHEPVLLSVQSRARSAVVDEGGDGALHAYMTLPGAPHRLLHGRLTHQIAHY
jgi:hypothetical protein